MSRRLVFLGTPVAAEASLRALFGAGHDIALVVTRSDARRGRGSANIASSVKSVALELGLPVSHVLDDVLDVNAELGVVVAFGAIIPARILERVPMLNVHFSLLPRWRGAAPVERAILAGDEETGVCVMNVDPTLDTGAIYARRATPILDKTATSLTDELAELGAQLLVDVLTHDPLPIPSAQVGPATYANKVAPKDFELDPEVLVDDLARRVRAGRATCRIDGRQVIVESARVGERHVGAGEAAMVEGELHLGAANGDLVVMSLRPEGSRTMSASSYWAGARAQPQSKWTSSERERP